MSGQTLADRLAARRGSTRPAAPRATTAGTPEQAARRVSTIDPDIYNVDEEDVGGTWFNDIGVGVVDTVSFGFADEGLAWLVSSLDDDMSYDVALSRARQTMGIVQERSPYLYGTGQVIGGLVPLSRVGTAAGLGRNAAQRQIRQAALEGAAYGGLYGYGSADEEDLFSMGRLRNAGVQAVFGAAGGFVMGTALYHGSRLAKHGFNQLMQLRAGRTPRIDFDYAPIGSRAVNTADDVAEDIASLRGKNARGRPRGDDAAPAAPRQAPVNRLTGKASDEIEDGALASADDLIDTGKRELLFEKLAKMSPAEAKVAAARLTEAMESGDLTTDPHFRSIIGLDLTEFGDLEKVIPEVADILTDLGEGLLTKAGMGRTTTRSMEQELRARYGGSITEGQLDDLVTKVRETRGSANTGKIVMTLAGVQFARVAKDVMPKVLQGDAAARTMLADELATALRVSAKGQFLLSEAGRNLGMTRHSKNLLLRDVEDGVVVESLDEIKKRVQASFAKLDDEGLNELLAQTRDLSNLEEISAVLLDPRRAEQVSIWMRFRNTFEAFIKSNTLTPATAVINLVGVPIHNWVRNGGARLFAEVAARASGDTAQATVLMLQRQAASAVRWSAHMEGLKAAMRRVKWEALGSWKSIAGVAGSRRAALRAGASRQAMISRGYKPPPIREFDLKKRLAVTDIQGFNERLAERAASGAPFATLVNTMERVGATALNTVDALGTATAKIASGVIDDYGRAMVMTKEVYAEMAGAATELALRRGVGPDELGDFVAKQTKEWATIPPEEILSRVERRLIEGDDLSDVDRMLLRRDYDAEKEAERVLFLDGAQTKPGRAFAEIARGADNIAGLGQFKGILMPYIDTPTRILERGLASYTPWGHLTRESQEILARGGTDAAIERARMELGGTIIGAGMLAAATGAITITNGADYRNSANLGGAPANRVNLPGGGFVEFGRLEPLAMGFAMGGVIGQMWKASQEAGDRYGQDDAIAEAFAVAYGGFRDAILEKSYLTGLNELFEAFSSNDEAALSSYFQKFAPDAVARTIPLSGTFRQLNETISGRALEAATALDRIAKVTPGMGMYLPTRVDALGNEIEGRFMGIAAGTTADDDEITTQLRELGVDITNLRKADPTGFDLTSEELSDLRRIRAHEAVNSDGMTMREALEALFADPVFQSMPDRAMQEDAVVEVMSKFNQPAREIYEYRNQQYLADRQAQRSLQAYISDGLSNQQAQRAAREDIQNSGLPDPYRITR